MTTEPSVIACEKCGSPTEVVREGRTQGLRCTKCDWSVVTTYTRPIQLDGTLYEVRLVHGDYKSARHVKAIAHVTGVNFLAARRLLREAHPVVFNGKAEDAGRARAELVDVGITVEIRPDYPW
jgi:hypothetical protein